MNKTLLLGSLLFASCSQIVVKPVAHVVRLPYAGDLVSATQKNMGRTPASVSASEKSPRRVYFSTLYFQYLVLAESLQKKNTVLSCPQFHHDKIETDTQVRPRLSFVKAAAIPQEAKDYFPELAFTPNYTFDDHHRALTTEIETLCEEGVSDNFFKYDNLITHHASKKAFHKDQKSMESVLKIPVFANFYLVKMLEGKTQSRPTEVQFIRLSQTNWFESYVSEAAKLRQNFIKTTYVKR